MPASAPSSSLLTTFHDSYHDLVRFVSRRAGQQAARDLVHDAWLRLAERQSADAAQGAGTAATAEPPQQRAYLYAVVENITIDHLRRSQRTAERFDSRQCEVESVSGATPDVADAHAYRQALAEVEHMLGQLPARCRDIFLADRIEGASHAELAQRHGVSVKTVEREVMRAMDGVEAALRRWRGEPVTVRRGRRRALSTLLGLAGLGVGSPALWLAWRQWMPQYQELLATATGRLLRQRLPDGSELTLDADSRAQVSYYAARRQVQLLAGSAFFAVAHAPQRPFVVQARDVRITVLGTRFEVALHSDAVQVAVESGRVAVRDADGAEHELGAGQTLRLAPGQPARLLPPASGVAGWREGWLDFQGTPLAEVVSRLQRYSPQALRVQPEAAALPVLGRVRIAAATDWLRLLPRTLPVSVREQGPQRTLVISRRG